MSAVPLSPESRALRGKLAAETSWAKTPDRSARTAPARASSPSSIDYHLAKLDPAVFADATDAQRLAAADSAKKAYYSRLALKSAQARRRKSGP